MLAPIYLEHVATSDSLPLYMTQNRPVHIYIAVDSCPFEHNPLIVLSNASLFITKGVILPSWPF